MLSALHAEVTNLKAFDLLASRTLLPQASLHPLRDHISYRYPLVNPWSDRLRLTRRRCPRNFGRVLDLLHDGHERSPTSDEHRVERTA